MVCFLVSNSVALCEDLKAVDNGKFLRITNVSMNRLDL